MLALLAPPLCDACDYCLLGQGISPLQTQTGAGIRVSPRYTLLDSVYDGDNEVSNPGVKEKYWTTDVAGFYSLERSAAVARERAAAKNRRRR